MTIPKLLFIAPLFFKSGKTKRYYASAWASFSFSNRSARTFVVK